MLKCELRSFPFLSPHVRVCLLIWERGREREREEGDKEREKHPGQRSNPQPRYEPCLGTEPATFFCRDWANQPGLLLSFLKVQMPITVLIHEGTIQGRSQLPMTPVSPCNSRRGRKARKSSQLNLRDSESLTERSNDLIYFMEGGKRLPENPLTCQ